MARSVDEIQIAIITDVQSLPELAAANSTSKRAIWRLWTFVVASAIAIFEQLMDVFKSEMETTVSLAAPQTTQWFQNKCLLFQYSATDPQVLQLINLVPQYPLVNTTLRIVTRCSVRTTINNTVLIKAAKNEPPEPLDSGELSALQSYVGVLGVAGVYYSVLSQESDKLYIAADVYYNGAYSAIISSNVIASITAYLSSLPFDGAMRINDLEAAMRGALGVNDVVLRNVKARANGTTLANATYLVLNSQFIGRLWSTVSGYIVGETTPGSTFADTLNFIPE